MIFDKPLPDSPYDVISDDTGLPKQTIKAVLVRLMGVRNEQGWSQANRFASRLYSSLRH